MRGKLWESAQRGYRLRFYRTIWLVTALMTVLSAFAPAVIFGPILPELWAPVPLVPMSVGVGVFSLLSIIARGWVSRHRPQYVPVVALLATASHALLIGLVAYCIDRAGFDHLGSSIKAP